jgi:hypothetical protein
MRSRPEGARRNSCLAAHIVHSDLLRAREDPQNTPGTNPARGALMPIRVSPTLLLPAVLCAAVAAYLVADHSSSSAATTTADTTAAARAPDSPGPSSGALPPGHPPITGMSPHGPHGMTGAALPNGDNQEPPAITWTAPSSWQSEPNPNAMRLATYKVEDGAELSVARAGGSVGANVDRWAAQFDGSPHADRTQRQVHGLQVTVVRIAGTFLGAGMSPAAPEKHEGWAMLAAIVDSSGSPYFFKLLGPADQVDHARAAFDALVASVTPRDTK